MRTTYIGLAAALCWSGVLGAQPAKGQDGMEGVPGDVTAGHRRVPAPGRQRQGAGSNSAHNTSRNGERLSRLELRQSGAQCGSGVGSCPSNLCCSDYGFCGDTIDHCYPLFGCQAQYGTCGWPRTAPQPTTTAAPPPPPPPTSTTSSTSTTPPPPPPPTTSSTSTTPTSVYTPPPPPPSTTSTPVRSGVTTNGMCGNGTLCIGSPNYGPCCSQFFWCGSSLDFCGAGCQSQFGACFGVPGQPGPPASNVTTTYAPPPVTTTSTTSTTIRITTTSTTSTTPPPPPPPPSTTSTTARPTPTVVIPPGLRSSTDGTCGSGVTCLGSTFGRCCSQFGYCGDGDQFCPYIVGCQSDFGYCDPPTN
ncbi:hypothetical protein B0T24DRAFT_659382 [Lasiosphaeria ovina]|uniref:Chitin-binding type-1 domain-containing protein n=1 Tax=Lasiosphaeria ovina TaxID=92902 RepID=A0AAE0JZS7_9PEZI|nr:hypothetical protein B0T24DRAFT_659382 [Lasiosphaeria ovina]